MSKVLININNPQFTGAHRCSTNNTLE